MSKFKVGDTVRISKRSEYYSKGDQANPIDISGVVIQVNSDYLGTRVQWNNGRRNVYEIEDLELVKDESTTPFKAADVLVCTETGQYDCVQFKVGDTIRVNRASNSSIEYDPIDLNDPEYNNETNLYLNQNYFEYFQLESKIEVGDKFECISSGIYHSVSFRAGDTIEISRITGGGRYFTYQSGNQKYETTKETLTKYFKKIEKDSSQSFNVGDQVQFLHPINEIIKVGVIRDYDTFFDEYSIDFETVVVTVRPEHIIRLVNKGESKRKDKRMAERKEATDNIYKNLFEDYIMEFKDDLKAKVAEELEKTKGTLTLKIKGLESENKKLQERADKATKDMWEAMERMENKPVVNFGTVEAPNEKLVHPAFHTMSKILGSQKRTYKNIMIVGPAGSGKTHLSSSVAEALKLDYYPMSVGSQTTKSDLMGFINAKGGYQSTPVREAFENGGILLLDEFDAAHAGVVTILNSLLSNEIVSFPDKQITKHEKFIVVVACNTYGKGATSEYVGRNKLDAATLDRFVVVDVTYDKTLEQKLLGKGFTKIMKNIDKIRQNAKDQAINVVISPRASMNVADLVDGGFTMKEALEMAVIKGAPESVKVKLLKGITYGKK